MPTTTDWSTRPVPSALSAEELAAFVDRSISRTEGFLFTATPTEELDAIGRWQQLKDQAFAGQMREIVAAHNRATAEQREFAADEVGLAIGATTTTGGNLVHQALSLAALPGFLEAVESGQLTERHVLAALRELNKVDLTPEQRHAVVLVMLARYRGQAPGDLAALVTRLIVQVDRAAAEARDRKATAGRRVSFSRDVDGQALVIGRGPAEQIAAIRAALEATLPDQPEPGDERTGEAREFDLFVDLLTGGAQAGSWQAEVIVPFSVAEGGDLELGEIPGLGPILPATARDLLEQCDTITQVAVHDEGRVIAVSDPFRVAEPAAARTSSGVRFDFGGRLAAPPVLRDLTGSGYVFSPRLRRYLQARDRTCVYPGCGETRPAHRQGPPHPLACRRHQRRERAMPVPPSPPRQAGRVHRHPCARRQLSLDHPRRLAVPPTSQGLLTLRHQPAPPQPQTSPAPLRLRRALRTARGSSLLDRRRCRLLDPLRRHLRHRR